MRALTLFLLLLSACSVERASLFVKPPQDVVTQEQFQAVLGVIAARLEALEGKQPKK